MRLSGRLKFGGATADDTTARTAALISARFVSAMTLWFVFFLIAVTAPDTFGQKRQAAKPKPKADVTSELAKSAKELARLQQEFIKATNDYKDLLKKQSAGLQRNLTRAEEQYAQSQKLFAEGLISRNALESSERAVVEAKDKITDVDRSLTNADSQIAATLLEAEAERKIARSKPLPRGGMVRTAALIRYNGAAVWALSDAWKVQRFFLDSFKKPLPVAVFGQGVIHDRWRLDHRNAMDVSLHPDGPEGQALLAFLRANGIPFLAFREAIPGTATGPHVHIGRPSHRY